MAASLKTQSLSLPSQTPSTSTPEGAAIVQWVQANLRPLVERLNAPGIAQLIELHEEPPKPRTGLLAYADGSDWGPTDDAGLHVFDGTNWLRALTSNDWAVGTFTPTMAFATPGTSSFAYSAQQGDYLRIGSWYFIHAQLVVTPTIGTGSGDVQIGGLPANAARNSAGSLSEAGGANLTWAASRTMLGFRLTQSADYGIITQMGSAQGTAVIQASNLTNGSSHTFRVSAGYRGA